MNMQVSFRSPPIGPAAFCLKPVAPPHISLTDIFWGGLAFIGIQLLVLAVLLMWPGLVAVFLEISDSARVLNTIAETSLDEDAWQ